MDSPLQITDDEVFDAKCDCCGQVRCRLHLAVRRSDARTITICRTCAYRLGV